MSSFSLNKNKTSEVQYIRSNLKKLSYENLQILLQESKLNLRNRKRYCMHDGLHDRVHEMFIVHSKNTYIRPHAHIEKSESILILKGKLKYMIFDSSGKIKDTFIMSEYSNKKSIFYNRIKKNTFHSFIILSKYIIFLEVTSGPFKKSNTKFANWSPNEHDCKNGLKFIKYKVREFDDK